MYIIVFDVLFQRGPTTGPRMEFVRPAEQFCTSLVDRKQRQPCITRHGELMEESLGLRPIPSEDFFFFGERYDFWDENRCF